MPPDGVVLDAASPDAGSGAMPTPWRQAPWRQALVRLVLASALQFAVFWRQWAEMADQWWNSSTYSHILLIPPILVWLVHQRRAELVRLTPEPWALPLAGFALALLGWVLGSFGGVALAQQGAVVAMQVMTVAVLLGPRVSAALLFPLGYAAFLVPFGDELVPMLQTITARLTIALVNLSGIPAVIEGVFIDTPAGLFEVAEACSGVKFLVAMVAFGALAAHVCFRSPWRRAGFMALCVALPVLANGVRAWGTIAIAQVKGAAYAGGVDHIVYGWFFFAIVIAVVIAAGWPFFDRSADAPLVDVERIEQSALLARIGGRPVAAGPVLAALAALVLAGQGWAVAASRLSAPLAAQIDLPEVRGWQRTDYAPALWWEPRARGAEHRLLGRYADARGQVVDVFIAVWPRQQDGSEAGGFGQGALVPDSGWAWQADVPAPDEARGEMLLGSGKVERLAQTSYRTGALITGSNVRLRLANMVDRLLLRARPTTMLILSAERSAATPDPAAAIAAFRSATGPTAAWMDRVAQVR